MPGMRCALRYGGLVRNQHGHKPIAERTMQHMFFQITRLAGRLRRLRKEVEGSIFVEYLLLLTLVGIGVIVGLAAVRTALINELLDLANAINAINCP